ncbi:MaoC family dehydratase N-terminal domain-containing protein [Alcaligenaceae bacterium]|nr:MaoC family dehydratase N-terminal domain-containing protein [Alcaligenaceae bacterium]
MGGDTSAQIFARDLSAGALFKGVSRRVDMAMFRDFAALTGDKHPIHYDAEYARQTDFGACVAHGLLLVSLAALGASDLSGQLRDSMVALVAQESRFIEPVFPDDHIQITYEVISTGPPDRRGRSRVTFGIDMRNQHDRTVFTGSHQYLLKWESESA